MACQCSTSSLTSNLSRSLKSSVRPSTAPLRRQLPIRRLIATSSTSRAPDENSEDKSREKRREVDESILTERRETRATLYKEWLGSGESERYRRPTPGRPNWIGDEVPYPDNPSFKPQPPLSAATRNEIFSLYELGLTGKPAGSDRNKANAQRHEPQPEGQVLRKISASYGLALERVRAIVRLVAVEREMTLRGRALQTKFSAGMESYLGVSRTLERQRVDPPKEERTRLTKKIWEYINEEEGAKPILPAFLQDRSSTSTSTTKRTQHRSLVGLGDYGPPPFAGYPVQTPTDGPPAPNEASRLKIIDVSKTPIGDALARTWRNSSQAKLRSERKQRAKARARGQSVSTAPAVEAEGASDSADRLAQKE